MTVWNARIYLVILVAAFIGCSSSKTGSNGAANKDSNSSAYGSKQLANCEAQLEEMKTILKLDEAAAKALTASHNSHVEKMKSWFEESGVELVALRKEALDAARDKDLAKLREMEADGKKKRVAELTEEERVLVAEHTELLLDSVSPDQAAKFKAHVIAEQLLELLEFLEPLELTDSQVTEVRELAEKVIPRFASNAKWRSEGTIKLEQEVAATVLTAEQRNKFQQFDGSKRLERLRWSN